ncbi:hypothetical protein AMEX_G9539 [Astyanax mexicanus]|uniref:Cadherin-like beta-sandwich-like domain-containing protein n=1 Tax=Astyanax mexicanus TaxID=7994 RepID=A0A8T2LT36_ASTMX|nr:hypothetical protein AMEX_G9539 [Astyanax mexicanus]
MGLWRKKIEYLCSVSFDCLRVSVGAQVPDPCMQITVREACSSGSVSLNAGDTLIPVQVTSPDGANSQVYTVMVTREQIPVAVSFCDVRDQMAFECPVSLNALYRPVSINQSDSKAVFSSPYIDMLTRRSKVHPFTERPLGDSWRVEETELDSRMSNTSVNCCFTHRGCKSVLKLAEVGAHAKDCPYKPPLNLNTKASSVTETNWYRNFFTSSGSLNIETKHSLKIRKWEKRLQAAVGEGDVEDLCCRAQNYINLYRKQIPKAGGKMHCEKENSPLDCLEQAAIHYATAIKFKPQDSQLHFLLGKTLEEFYYASELYGLKKKAKEEDQDLSEAQTSGRREEILAICSLHGFSGTVSVENQLKALDKELQLLKEQGQSGKADYVQTLHIWLCKTAGKMPPVYIITASHPPTALVAVFAARAVSMSAVQGEMVQQLEWVLLDAHFALLQILVQQQSEITQAWNTRRCQALGALIRLSCIAPCRKLLDMQERVCEMGVMTTPCSSTALCQLGLAQLAQYDSDSSSVRGQASLADACLSFQASIALEGLPLTGDAPELLTKQAWWQNHWVKEKERRDRQASIKTTGVNTAFDKTGEGTATGRGRSAAAAKSTPSAPARGVRTGPARGVRTGPARGVRTGPAARQRGQASRGAAAEADVGVKSPGEVSCKISSAGEFKQECRPPQADSAAESVESKAGPESPAVALNRKGSSARLGLARALSHSPDSHEQACRFYREVIALDPEVYDAYIELGNLLVSSDPLAAVHVYSHFPFKPVTDQTFDEAFLTGEIVRILMKQELFDHPQLLPNLIAYGKVMGLSCLEKYIDVLDKKFKTKLLKHVYAGIHHKSLDDEDLQQFFKFKCWI